MKNTLTTDGDSGCVAEIYFLLADGSNLFDADAVSPRSQLTEVPVLESPRITRKHVKKVSAYEALADPGELLNHYRQIISIASNHGVAFDQFSHNFWLRLEIGYADADENITFDWYDNLTEIKKFIDWVQEGALYEYNDMDQHWQVIARRNNNYVEIIQRDPDKAMDINLIELSFNSLSFALSEVFDSAQTMIKYLSEGVGDDVWTDYSRTLVMMGRREEVKFGTDTWVP